MRSAASGRYGGAVTLAHDLTGDGPTVLLLHSTAGDRRMWEPQVPALVAAGYRVLRCDLRGFGGTPAPDAPYNDADDVTGLLDALAVDRTAVIASSGGGQVAQELAARDPGRVTALALLCTAMAGHEPSPALQAFFEREDALLAAGDLTAATELNVHTWLGPHADEQTRDLARVMQRHAFGIQSEADVDVEPIEVPYDVATITAPVLLVSGDHDLPDFREIAVHLAGRLPQARHVPLPWAGHLPSMERPDETNRLLLDFLTATVPPR